MALSHGIGLLALSHSLTSAAVIGSTTCYISVDDYLLGFWVDGVDYFGQPTPIGCYKENSHNPAYRAMPTHLENINSYSGYQRCAYEAKAYDYFAVQNGLYCFATDDLDAAMQYGSSNACNKRPERHAWRLFCQLYLAKQGPRCDAYRRYPRSFHVGYLPAHRRPSDNNFGIERLGLGWSRRLSHVVFIRR